MMRATPSDGRRIRPNRPSLGAIHAARNEDGFTLVELLVVVVVIGVLIAIAIPIYLNHTRTSNDKAAQSDVRNATLVIENCGAGDRTYPTADFTGGSATAASSTTAGTCSQKINASKGTTFKYFVNSTGVAGTNYLVVGANTSGNTNTYYCYASAAGGSVTKITADKTGYFASC